MAHCRLAFKEIGVDVENGFKPKYEVSPDKKGVSKWKLKRWQ
jgi:DNA topoisomerase-1